MIPRHAVRRETILYNNILRFRSDLDIGIFFFLKLVLELLILEPSVFENYYE